MFSLFSIETLSFNFSLTVQPPLKEFPFKVGSDIFINPMNNDKTIEILIRVNFQHIKGGIIFLDSAIKFTYSLEKEVPDLFNDRHMIQLDEKILQALLLRTYYTFRGLTAAKMQDTALKSLFLPDVDGETLVKWYKNTHKVFYKEFKKQFKKILSNMEDEESEE